VALDLVALFERGGSASPAEGQASSPDQLKSTMTQLLVDSGLLEALVVRIVRRELEEGAGASSGGVASSDNAGVKEAAGEIVKEFLSENLGKIFKDQIEAVVQTAVAEFLAGEGVKELVDDKFRAVTMYMKSDVIPQAVKNTLKDLEAEPA